MVVNVSSKIQNSRFKIVQSSEFRVGTIPESSGESISRLAITRDSSRPIIVVVIVACLILGSALTRTVMSESRPEAWHALARSEPRAEGSGRTPGYATLPIEKNPGRVTQLTGDDFEGDTEGVSDPE